MPTELTEEMEHEIINSLRQDVSDMQQLVESSPSVYNRKLEYRALEQLSYIIEQFRLKLRMLGAPRIYQ